MMAGNGNKLDPIWDDMDRYGKINLPATTIPKADIAQWQDPGAAIHGKQTGLIRMTSGADTRGRWALREQRSRPRYGS